MAKLEDLIKQIPDAKLRAEIAREAAALKSTKKFGLVFEEHIPEQVQLPGLPVRTGSRVIKRSNKNNQVFQVVEIMGNTARLAPEPEGQEETVKLDELVVVKRFGEPIYPALTPRDRVERAPDKPWHTIINADNFHALQLLLYCYEGMVDVIYIDPPYNTGARDWKYNNDYVDVVDEYRHSKWLAMMKKRLALAKKLLKPDTGVLIVTIDEHEIHHLGMLLEQEFPDAYRQLVTIVITARGVAKRGLARVEEYALYAYLGTASASETADDFLNNDFQINRKTPWASLLRRGTNAAPSDRPGLVYPIYINPDTNEILGVGETLDDRIKRGELNKRETNTLNPARSKSEAWPIRSDGLLGTWQVSPNRLMQLKEKGFVKIGRFDENRVSWAVNYLKRGPLAEIERGELIISGYEWESGPAVLEYPNQSGASRRGKTVWHRTLHDAGTYGAGLIRTILGNRAFEFPKSLYVVKDTLSTVVGNKPDALIIDFFAGSGTTLNAVNLLNATDGGQRRCVLVTNNEVSDNEAKAIALQGYKPGDDEWEQRGICHSVTWPRSKYTIQGRRDDDTELDGEYFTGKVITKEKPRRFKHIGFLSAEQLNTTAKKKQLISLLKDFPQSLAPDDSAFIVSADYSASILFDEVQADAWLEALEEQDHVTDFYIVAGSKATFDAIKAWVTELLGPLTEIEEEKRPMRTGFEENLEYFRLDFLDPHEVAYGEKFDAILPILWLMSGAQGKRENDKGEKVWFIPKGSPFAVLIDEHAFSQFKQAIAKRADLTHIFLVTDSMEAYRSMLTQLPDTLKTKMLYKSYLDNFRINTEQST